MRMRTGMLLLIVLVCNVTGVSATDPADDPKPTVAIFPIGGDAPQTARERAAMSFRAKLDRTENFTVLDGYKMKDLAAEAKAPVTFDTPPDVVKELASVEKADVILWGDLSGKTLRVKVLDLRQG